MSSAKTQQSQCISFLTLLSQYDSVEIPIIQRDYAQGRESKEKIREHFLKAIKDSFSNEPLELDFIYGDIKDKVFRPLDGQQRLTSLFLLHWYAAHREPNLPKGYELLKRFTYETRVSSRDFCKRLVSSSIPLTSGDKSISLVIRDCNWFYRSWEKDPSVAGMLTMLNSIENSFNDVSDLWDKLTIKKVPVFNFIDLKSFGLSDDLYIKMNARGKQLSDFENFKAQMIKKIQKQCWDQSRKEIDRFSIKVDTIWMDLFWKLRSTDGFDERYMRFIANSLICSLATDGKTLPKDILIKKLQTLHGNPNSISPDDFDKRSYEILYDWLDCYMSKHPDITKLIDLGLIIPSGESVISDCTGNNITWEKLILFYAQTGYLVKYKKLNTSAFSDWIRVVRNVLQNSTIDSAEQFIYAIKLIRELLPGSGDIYEYLENTTINSNFAELQMKEEKRKAKLIQVDSCNKAIIHKAEDTNFSRGHITFSLYCATKEGTEQIQFDILEKTTSVLNQYFRHDNDLSDEVRRALFCIGNGKFFEYWSSWLYAVNCPKYRLIPDMKELRKFADNPDYRHYLKELIELLFNKTLDEIIDDYPSNSNKPTWKDQIITNPDLLAKTRSKYIALDEEKGICYLIPGTRVSDDKAGIARLVKVSSIV